MGSLLLGQLPLIQKLFGSCVVEGCAGEGAVVGARAAVFKDVAPWTVVGGNPAKYIKERKINGER